MLIALTTCTGRGVGGEGLNVEKERTGVKWASHDIYIINKYHAHRLSSFIALLIFYVSYFKICNSLLFVNFTHLFQPCYLPLGDPCKPGIFSVSPLACRLNAR